MNLTLERASTMCDIRLVNNVALQVACANLVISHNLPFDICKSPRFGCILLLEKAVDSTFEAPG